MQKRPQTQCSNSPSFLSLERNIQIVFGPYQRIILIYVGWLGLGFRQGWASALLAWTPHSHTGEGYTVIYLTSKDLYWHSDYVALYSHSPAPSVFDNFSMVPFTHFQFCSNPYRMFLTRSERVVSRVIPRHIKQCHFCSRRIRFQYYFNIQHSGITK